MGLPSRLRPSNGRIQCWGLLGLGLGLTACTSRIFPVSKHAKTAFLPHTGCKPMQRIRALINVGCLTVRQVFAFARKFLRLVQLVAPPPQGPRFQWLGSPIVGRLSISK